MKGTEGQVSLAKKFADFGYSISATPATAARLSAYGLDVRVVELSDDAPENTKALFDTGEVDFVVSTSKIGRRPARLSTQLRRRATERNIATFTSLDTANALADSLLHGTTLESCTMVDIARIERGAGLMAGITIRPMEQADYAGVRTLWDAIPGMGLNAHDDSPEGIARFLARNPGMSFLAFDGKALVGAILAGHDGRRGGIYHACVAEGHRGRGIGQLLLKAALDALRTDGINKTRLLCYRDNEIGNRFWQQMGWTHREDTRYYDYIYDDMNAKTTKQEQNP